jgi:hypothetical protein
MLKESSNSGASGIQNAKGSIKTSQTITSPTGAQISTGLKSSQSLKDSSSAAKEGDTEPYDFFKYKGDNAKYGNSHTLETENKKSIPKAGEATQRKTKTTLNTLGEKMPRLKDLVNEFLNKKIK